MSVISALQTLRLRYVYPMLATLLGHRNTRVQTAVHILDGNANAR